MLRLVLFLVTAIAPSFADDVKLLNAAFDVSREFYADYDAAFVARWAREHAGQRVAVEQSHGGSSKQARAVIDGLEADVVAMNQALDIDQIAQRAQLLPTDWAKREPHGSAPNASTILFLVRKGNPKGIRDWGDLAKPGIKIVVPNPKTSGNGRYSWLAAFAWAKRTYGGAGAEAAEADRRIEAFLAALIGNAPVLDTGGRAATTTFAQRGIGDALLTFEAEIAQIRTENPDLEVVAPSVSILAENPVTWVDRVVAKHGTAGVAKAFVDGLFTEEGQEIAAKHGFRPRDPAVLARHGDAFAKLDLVTVDELAGGWAKAYEAHFADGALYDRLTGNQ